MSQPLSTLRRLWRYEKEGQAYSNVLLLVVEAWSMLSISINPRLNLDNNGSMKAAIRSREHRLSHCWPSIYRLPLKRLRGNTSWASNCWEVGHQQRIEALSPSIFSTLLLCRHFSWKWNLATLFLYLCSAQTFGGKYSRVITLIAWWGVKMIVVRACLNTLCLLTIDWDMLARAWSSRRLNN